MSINRSNFINNQQGYLDSVIFTSIIILLYVITLLFFRKQYQSTYSEDQTSFSYNGIFSKNRVMFDDIKRAKMYSVYRGGTGIKIEDVNGEKYLLRDGFYNRIYISKYLNLNTKANLRDNMNKWTELESHREQLPKDTDPKITELAIKLHSRLNSFFTIYLKPRMNKVGNGIEQRPSKALLIFSIILTIPMLLGIIKLYNNILKIIKNPNEEIIGTLILAITILVLAFLILFIYFEYKRIRYYEDSHYFEYYHLNHNFKSRFNDITEIKVLNKKIYLQSVFDDRPQEYYLKTNTIKPNLLIDYITNNYEIVEDNFKTMYLNRKK